MARVTGGPRRAGVALVVHTAAIHNGDPVPRTSMSRVTRSDGPGAKRDDRRRGGIVGMRHRTRRAPAVAPSDVSLAPACSGATPAQVAFAGHGLDRKRRDRRPPRRIRKMGGAETSGAFCSTRVFAIRARGSGPHRSGRPAGRSRRARSIRIGVSGALPANASMANVRRPVHASSVASGLSSAIHGGGLARRPVELGIDVAERVVVLAGRGTQCRDEVTPRGQIENGATCSAAVGREHLSLDVGAALFAKSVFDRRQHALREGRGRRRRPWS